MLVLLGGVGNQGNHSRPLQARGEKPLMSGAVTGDTAWDNLAAFRDIITQTLNVFVVNVIDLVGAEYADLPAWEALAWWTARRTTTAALIRGHGGAWIR